MAIVFEAGTNKILHKAPGVYQEQQLLAWAKGHNYLPLGRYITPLGNTFIWVEEV